jgi:twitching motility protein PilT
MSAEKISQQVTQLLVERDLLAPAELTGLEERAAATGEHVLRLIIGGGHVRRSDMLRVVATRWQWEYLDLESSSPPDPAALGRLSREYAVAQRALPVRIDSRGRVIIAVDDPFDQERLDLIAKAATGEVRFALCERDVLLRMVRTSYAMVGSEAKERPRRIQPEEDRIGTDEPELHVDELLGIVLDRGASDLHLTAGTPPQIRVNGALVRLPDHPRLMPTDLRRMVYSILTSHQREQFEERLELDLSHSLPGRARFRVNVFQQRNSIGAVMRVIPNTIKGLGELGLPQAIEEFVTLPKGLVLVTGATGTGKSTTLAALIDIINATRSVHVMTIEDPIEFMHSHKKAIVNQREIGTDTRSFAAALRHALRQDPDVILVGELRDLETIETAITAAETGHLVFATLHTQNAPQTVERLIDVFPPHQQLQVRVQLAASLQGVVSQFLVPTADGRGRIPAVEVMVVTSAIRNLIREGKVHQIRSAIQSGGRHGMITMEQSLATLVKSGRIALGDATECAQNVDELLTLLGKATQ